MHLRRSARSRPADASSQVVFVRLEGESRSIPLGITGTPWHDRPRLPVIGQGLFPNRIRFGMEDVIERGRQNQPVVATQFSFELIGRPAGAAEIDPKLQLRVFFRQALDY